MQKEDTTAKACCADGEWCSCVAVDDDQDIDYDGMFDDHLMSASLYSKHKKAVWSALCSSADRSTPPRVLKAGIGCAFAAARNVRLFLKKAGPGYTVVRGYKLLCIEENQNFIFTFKGQSHLVVRTPEGTLFDPTKHIDGIGKPSDEYVFAPSTRMHSDLTDTQLLSGAFLFNTVLSGDPKIVNSILRMNACISRFLQKNNVRSPEAFATIPRIHLDELPFLAEWLNADASEIPIQSAIDASLSFGARFLTASEDECNDPELSDVCCGSRPLEGIKDNQFEYEKNMWLPSTQEFLSWHEKYLKTPQKLPKAIEIKKYIEFYTTLEAEYLSRSSAVERKINFEFKQRSFY